MDRPTRCRRIKGRNTRFLRRALTRSFTMINNVTYTCSTRSIAIIRINQTFMRRRRQTVKAFTRTKEMNFIIFNRTLGLILLNGQRLNFTRARCFHVLGNNNCFQDSSKGGDQRLTNIFRGRNHASNDLGRITNSCRASTKRGKGNRTTRRFFFIR